MLFFSPLTGGGHAILSSRNRGGQHIFSYSEALSATPPSGEIYEQSLTPEDQSLPIPEAMHISIGILKPACSKAGYSD